MFECDCDSDGQSSARRDRHAVGTEQTGWRSHNLCTRRRRCMACPGLLPSCLRAFFWVHERVVTWRISSSDNMAGCVSSRGGGKGVVICDIPCLSNPPQGGAGIARLACCCLWWLKIQLKSHFQTPYPMRTHIHGGPQKVSCKLLSMSSASIDWFYRFIFHEVL